MEESIAKRVEPWLSGSFDALTKAEVRKLQQSDPQELADAFYRNLEFGTGGLRGLMGVGTNRMNKYTVGMATQGYSNYLKRVYAGQEIRVALAYDSRNNSQFFAETAAHVFAGNGIHVFLFEALRPTPELSFAIRLLKCQGGVVCTASHNPKEYNGYKAYWNDGGQLVPPHDKNVIREVEAIHSIEEVRWTGGDALIHKIGQDVDDQYMAMVKSLSVFPEVIKRHTELSIVYTPIHGTGITLVPQVLRQLGFSKVSIVEEQSVPDGNFPTVRYPNPEEAEAMSIGLEQARQRDADILLGTDPDSDRVGIGVKNHKGDWVLLNGNQTAVLVFNYLLESRKAKGIAKSNDMVVKTIVTTDLIDRIARVLGVTCYNVLTGFKWIAELIKEKEGLENYVVGGEESYGLMVGSQIRDKDAISAVALICEMAAYEKDQGRTLFQKLLALYVQYGCYQESLISITKKGRDGQVQIAKMMERFRHQPPRQLNGIPVVQLLDYELQKGKNLLSGEEWDLTLPKSNVLQFVLADDSKISARPSGTEPKIKFYFSVNAPLPSPALYDQVHADLEARIQGIITDLNP